MSRILVINSSLSGNASVSRILVNEAVQPLLAIDPDAVVTYRDLGDVPIPQAAAACIKGVPEKFTELVVQALSDELIAELKAADVVVIITPVCNLTIPDSLSAWFDYVLRPRGTYRYKDGWVEGLVTGTRAIVIESRGGIYSDEAVEVMDFQDAYLNSLFAFIGITDVTFIHTEKIDLGHETCEIAVTTAKSRLEESIIRGFTDTSEVRIASV